MSYAERTEVPVAKTQAEIQALLRARKADRYAFMDSADMGIISFELRGRRYSFHLPLPAPDGFRRTEGSPLERAAVRATAPLFAGGEEP